MHELLPLVLGGLFGAAAARAALPGPRAAVFVVSCVLAGVVASAINGELSGPLAGAFVSFDALLAWSSASVAFAASRMLVIRRRDARASDASLSPT